MDSTQQQQYQQGDSAIAYEVQDAGSTQPEVRMAHDENGVLYNDGPIPGFIDGAARPYHEWEDHLSHMFFGEPTKNRNGGVMLYTKPWRGAREGPRIQLVDIGAGDAPMRAPFGVRGRVFVDKLGTDVGDDETPSLELSFDNAEKQQMFFTRIDAAIRNVAAARFPRWFPGVKDAMRPLVIDEQYTGLVQFPKTKDGEPPKNYSPTLRTKLALYNPKPGAPNNSQERNTRVFSATPVPGGGPYDFHIERITEHAEILKIGPNSLVVPIIELSKIWFMNKTSWGVSARVVDLVVMNTPKTTSVVIQGMNIVPRMATSAQVNTATATSMAQTAAVQQQHQNGDGMDQESTGADGSAMAVDPLANGFGVDLQQYPPSNDYA